MKAGVRQWKTSQRFGAAVPKTNIYNMKWPQEKITMGRSTNTLALPFTGLSNCCCRSWKRRVEKVALGHHMPALEWKRRTMLCSALNSAHTMKLEGMGPHRINRENRERARTLGLLTSRGERSPESVPLGICCYMFWQMFRERTLWFGKISFLSEGQRKCDCLQMI